MPFAGDGGQDNAEATVASFAKWLEKNGYEICRQSFDQKRKVVATPEEWGAAYGGWGKKPE